MQKFLIGAAALALLTACSGDKNEVDIKKDDTATVVTPKPTDTVKAEYNIKQQFGKFAPITMEPDTSFLSPSERAVVNKLNEASKMMSAIYMRQLDVDNPKVRRRILKLKGDDRRIMLNMFSLHFGVCDSLQDNHVFFGDKPCPVGGGFYPEDMTKAEFEAHIDANPDDKDAFTSGYTVIRRTDDGGLKAVPYSQEYKKFLVPAAKLLREAADISENANLKKFLNLRAASFLSDDYFESEMAWMDLDGSIEVAIGPYEVYDDGLYGYKTAFESFVTIKDPKASAALSKYKGLLRDMEANLPVEEKYKNFTRGFESPIAVVDQVHGGGDNENGVQTIAFNLPNDERVRTAKGAKKVILSNVLGAKYDRILAPIGERVLVADQAKLTARKWMSNNTLFHELSHSLGPGTITVDGKETTVSAQLKELYSGIEEGKADVMGAYNVLYMMDRGELDKADRNAFLATYFTGKFRSMRFGLNAAHSKGAAYQYNHYIKTGAAKWLPEQERYELDFDKLAVEIGNLTGKIVRLQGDGDYNATKAFLDANLTLDAAAKTVLSNLEDIPYDIRPIYPDKI